MTDWTNGILMLSGIILYSYFYIGVNWSLQLFSNNKSEKNSVIKIVPLIFGVWLIPLLIQLMTEVTDANSGAAGILSLLEAFYGLSMWIAIIISSLTSIIFLLNILMYLGVDIAKVFNKKGGN